MKSKFQPDKNGYFGQFGGAFIPELLYPNVKELEDNYIQIIENKFRLLTPKIADYKKSKTDINIITIRHGFNLLKRSKELAYVRKKVIIEKAHSDLDNDFFAEKPDH